MARRCTAHMSVCVHPRQERTRTVDTVDDGEFVDECECVVRVLHGGGGGADVGCQTSVAVKLLPQPFIILTLGQGLTLRIHAGTKSRPYIWNKV